MINHMFSKDTDADAWMSKWYKICEDVYCEGDI